MKHIFRFTRKRTFVARKAKRTRHAAAILTCPTVLNKLVVRQALLHIAMAAEACDATKPN